MSGSRRCWLGAWACALIGAGPWASGAAEDPPEVAAERPNVIVLYTDDQGSVDMGCYGARDLETPAMDALARRGVRFTSFYSAAPVCSPSRAALLTGRYPQRAGVPGNVSSTRGDPGMSAEQVTIAELCGVPLPAGKIDGRSLVEAIRSASAPSPHAVFHWQTGGGRNPSWAVREGDWKLLGNPRDTSRTPAVPVPDALFLANLAQDPGEARNLAAESPQVVERLRRLHEEWVAEVTSP